MKVFLYVLWKCTAVRYMRRILRSKLFINRARRSISTYTTEMFSRTLYVQHPVSLRIFSPLPGSCQRFSIGMQVQHSYTFVQQCALCAEPCVPNCSLAEREGLNYICNGNDKQNPLAQHSMSLRTFPYLPGSDLRFLIAMQVQHSYAFFSSALYAQNPVLKTVH